MQVGKVVVWMFLGLSPTLAGESFDDEHARLGGGATRSVSQNPLGENDRKFLGSRHRWGTERARSVPAATANAGACFLQSRVTRRRDVDWLLTEPSAFKSAFGVLWGG